jgi:hypothetical protein
VQELSIAILLDESFEVAVDLLSPQWLDEAFMSIVVGFARRVMLRIRSYFSSIAMYSSLAYCTPRSE